MLMRQFNYRHVPTTNFYTLYWSVLKYQCIRPGGAKKVPYTLENLNRIMQSELLVQSSKICDSFWDETGTRNCDKIWDRNTASFKTLKRRKSTTGLHQDSEVSSDLQSVQLISTILMWLFIICWYWWSINLIGIHNPTKNILRIIDKK